MLKGMKSLQKGLLNKMKDRRAAYATLIGIDGDTASIRIGSSPTVLKNIKIIGSSTELRAGQTVSLRWVTQSGSHSEVPQIMASAQSGAVSTDQGILGSMYAPDEITITSATNGLSIKHGGVGLQHLSFAPAMINHTHSEILPGWTADADGVLTAGSTFIHPDGQISLGVSPDVLKLDSIHATYRFWIGNLDPTLAPFSVTKAGAISATSGAIGGWSLAATQLSSDTGSAFINSLLPAIGLGASGYTTGDGFWVGKDGGAYKLRIGDPAGNQMRWDGTDLILSGRLINESTISAAVDGSLIVAPIVTLANSPLFEGAWNIEVDKNTLESGDILYFQARGNVEYMQVTSGATGTGPYTYSVTRNLDGSGEDAWIAGDVAINTRRSGQGFLELYAGTNYLGSGAGPTIVAYDRNTSTYNDLAEVSAFGNLGGLYNQSPGTYGAGFGKYASGNSHVLVAGGSIKINNHTTTLGEWASSGSFTLGQVATSKPNVHWNGTDLQFRGGTDGTSVQAYIDGAGAFVAGAGAVTIDTGGIQISAAGEAEANSLRWIGGDYGPHIMKCTYGGPTAYQFEETSGVYGGAKAVGRHEHIVWGGDSFVIGLPEDYNYYGKKLRVDSNFGWRFYDNAGTYEGGINWQSFAYITPSSFYIAGTITGTGMIKGSNVVSTGGLYVGADVAPTSGVIQATASGKLGGGLYVGNVTGDVIGTGSIVLDQGSNDTDILHARSSDVGHGMTSIVPTNTYMSFKKVDATQGGVLAYALSEGDRAWWFVGLPTSGNNAKSTAAKGAVNFQGGKKNGTTWQNLAFNENIISFQNGFAGCRAVIDAEGDLHLDATSNPTAWDDYDDIKLLTGLRASVMDPKAELAQRAAAWIEEARPVLEATGVMTYNADGHHFVSMKKLQWLQIDAMRQLYETNLRLEERLNQMEKLLEERN